jgi:hypothetical protein
MESFLFILEALFVVALGYDFWAFLDRPFKMFDKLTCLKSGKPQFVVIFQYVIDYALDEAHIFLLGDPFFLFVFVHAEPAKPQTEKPVKEEIFWASDRFRSKLKPKVSRPLPRLDFDDERILNPPRIYANKRLEPFLPRNYPTGDPNVDIEYLQCADIDRRSYEQKYQRYVMSRKRRFASAVEPKLHGSFVKLYTFYRAVEKLQPTSPTSDPMDVSECRLAADDTPQSRISSVETDDVDPCNLSWFAQEQARETPIVVPIKPPSQREPLYFSLCHDE